MKLDCLRVQDEMPACERGELGAAMAAAVKAHLAACAGCRAAAAADGAILAALAEVPTVGAAPGFVAKVRAAVEREASPRRERLLRWAPLGVAAAVLVGAGTIVWMRLGPGTGPRDRDREVIAELDTLEQLDALGSSLALQDGATVLELRHDLLFALGEEEGR